MCPRRSKTSSTPTACPTKQVDCPAVADNSPLVLRVRDLMGKPGSMRELQMTLDAPEHYGEAVARVAQGSEVSIEGRLESVHEGILASGEIHTTAHAECVRCLEPLEVAIDADFQELFAYSGEDGYDNEVVDETIDLGPIVRDQVVLQLPFQPMCSPDCPGLDPETGEKRPEGWQESSEDRPDPRWEALRALVDQDNENGTSRE